MKALDLSQALTLLKALPDLGGLISHDITDDLDEARAVVVGAAVKLLDARYAERTARSEATLTTAPPPSTARVVPPVAKPVVAPVIQSGPEAPATETTN